MEMQSLLFSRKGLEPLRIALLLMMVIHVHSSRGQTPSFKCNPQLTTCSCGSSDRDHVDIMIYRCFDIQSQSCQLCDELSTENICDKYKNCQRCSTGLDRCLTCPEKKAGIWCEHYCNCLNDGVCDINGSCICQNGFTGEKCQTVENKVDFAKKLFHSEKNLNKVKRQAPAPSSSNGGLCPVPPAPDNGNIHTESSQPKLGEAIKYTCKENYTMMGSRTRHCMKTGQWAGEAPTCEKMCPFPPVSPFMQVKTNPSITGAPLSDSFGNEVISELEFSCSSGYALVGASRIRCASGIWDQEVPLCKMETSCNDPGIPEYGDRKMQGSSRDDYKIGTQIIYNCLPNYTLVGESALICMPHGSWTASLPICLPSVSAECSFSCKKTNSALQQVKEPLVCSTTSQRDITFVLKPEP